MKGTSKIREQGYKDPLLVKVMKDHGYDELPLYKHRPPEQQAQLRRVGQSSKSPHREVQRAQILLRYQSGETVAGIARSMEMTRTSIAKWINRALAIGPMAALYGPPRRGATPTLACEMVRGGRSC